MVRELKESAGQFPCTAGTPLEPQHDPTRGQLARVNSAKYLMPLLVPAEGTRTPAP
jgi:hypothetical protein